MRPSRTDVIAFRLHAHHLSERLEDDRLLEATGRCAVQNSPPGSALLAVRARVRGLTQARWDDAVATEKTLLQTWCMRGSPFFFPVADAPVFTAGALPPTEASLRHLLPGVGRPLDRLGLSLTEAVELLGAEIVPVLSGRRLAITALGAKLAERVAGRLTAGQQRIWRGAGPYAAEQPLGEGIVHFCLRILALQGVVCFAPRAGNTAPLVLVAEWLGHPIPAIDPPTARAELLRRYLHSYGPSTRGDFAAWIGVSAADADAWWTPVEEELTQVEFGGASWILTEDLDALRTAPPATGVRLLPPRDPYTQMRDRDTILDTTRHRQVWRTVGEPGAVLTNGRITGTWRQRKRGAQVTVTVTMFASLPASARLQLQEDAEQIAALRGAASVAVAITSA